MVSHGGAGNMNIRKDLHKHFSGSKKAQHMGGTKGLNETLVFYVHGTVHP